MNDQEMRANLEAKKIHVLETQENNLYEKKVIEEKLERLYEARSRTETIRNTIGDQKRRSKQKSENNTWKGQHYDWYHPFMNDDYNRAYNDYYKQSVAYLGAVCDEITKLENQSKSIDDSLMHLTAALNSIKEMEKRLKY